MKITKNTLKKAMRTFIQTAIGYIAVNIAVIDFSAEKTALKSALIGVAVSAASAGICAAMNLEKNGDEWIMTFDAWVKKYLGEKIDYDDVSGAQCVDLVKHYLNKVHGIKAGAWGNARDYWLSFASHAEMTANFKKIKNTPDFVPKKGDIVVWSGDISASNDYGHIAVATGEGNTSTFYSYDQNWNGKEFKRVKHTYFAVYGVLRPKNQSVIVSSPSVKLGVYTLTNVRGIYKGAGASTGRKKVKDLTVDGKRYATSNKGSADAYLKAGTAVSILETKLIDSGNLWARIPSGWLCIWECDIDKLFIK